MNHEFRPTASWKMLQARAKLLGRLRSFFDQRNFVEVETPVLSQDIVVDLHLDPLRTTLFSDPTLPECGPTYWLQTSPEFCLKRLLAAAHEEQQQANQPHDPIALYQIAKAFRGGERGRLHNPEFTLVEWYRVGDDYQAGMQLLSELAEELLERGTPDRIPWHAAFTRYAQLDPHVASLDELSSLAMSHGFMPSLPTQLDRGALIDFLLVRLVEPNLGLNQPTILYDYPADQAALAQVRGATSPNQPAVAERFELYVSGIELANGYHELLDPSVLRARNVHQNEARLAAGKFPLPSESRLLAAMEHGLPACSGCALGFDRWAMLVLGAESIAEVIAFPSERA